MTSLGTPDARVHCIDIVPDGTDRATVSSQLLAKVSAAAPFTLPSVLAQLESRDVPSYRDFLDALGVAVYTTDASGQITFFNEAAATIWGREPALGEEWCGSWRLYWSDGRPMRHDECPMAICLRENRSVRGGTAIAERPNGTRVQFIAYPSPLRDADGSLVGAVNVLVDVTEQVRVEGELRATADALRASNAVKDEFLGLISHELRTPVTTIFGNARLLRDRGHTIAEHDRSSMLTDMAEDSERLLRIIENLLLLTRLGAASEVDLEPQLLAHVVKTSVAAFKRRHPERLVSVHAATGNAIVEADRTYLELVVENLLSNANKYSPAAAEITVEIVPRDGEARVRVLDRGIGIRADDLGKVFSPFYRGDVAPSLATGLGIGLAVCRRVVELQGGRVWAGARNGGGAEVGFALPLLEADQLPD